MPTDSTHSTRVSVADLLDRPGASRPLDLELPAPDDLALPLVDAVGPLHLAGVLESVVDGILVRGTLRTPMTVACARCLAPVTDDVEADVTELYRELARVDPDDELEEGYEIADAAIDLDRLIRDTLAPAAPLAPRCRPDCKGLCATCGKNLNEGDCDCPQEVADSRWAALQGLRLDEGGQA